MRAGCDVSACSLSRKVLKKHKPEEPGIPRARDLELVTYMFKRAKLVCFARFSRD